MVTIVLEFGVFVNSGADACIAGSLCTNCAHACVQWSCGLFDGIFLNVHV